MSRRPLTLFIDASLLRAPDVGDLLLSVGELGLLAVVVEEEPGGEWPAGVGSVHRAPDDLADAWLLTERAPRAGSVNRSRTIVIGPRMASGRQAEIGLRSARDLRTAVLELASEYASDMRL
jgi:hypothetical protein